MTRCALVATLAGLLLGSTSVPAQGDLRRVYSAIHPGPKYPSPILPATRSNTSYFGVAPGTELGEGFGTGLALLGVAGVTLATLPFWGPHSALDAGFNERGWFPAYPYVMDDRPFMVVGNSPRVPIQGDDYFESHFVKPWSLRLGADVGDDFDDLRRFGGHLFLDTSLYRLGFLANWNYYREDLGNGATDEAMMSDYNLTWRFTQSDRVQLHVGAGARLWNYAGNTDVGFNALYRGDWFPINGLHISGIWEMGTLKSTLVMHGQAQIGYSFWHAEVFVGYDWFRIKSVTLQGPTLGLRLWF